MRWCDSHGIGHVLGLARNPVLERSAADWTGRADRQFRKTAQPQRDLRLVLLRGLELGPLAAGDRQGRAQRAVSNPRFIVVNVPGDPQELYEDFYCQRGNMENRIKEQQLDLFADRTSCHRFLATQFRLVLELGGVRVLVQALRRTYALGHGSPRRPKSGRSG